MILCVDNDTGYLKRKDETADVKIVSDSTHKLFNFTPNMQQEYSSGYLKIIQNPEYEYITNNEYRQTPRQLYSIKIEKDKPVKRENKILQPQEGKTLWTHTLLLKSLPACYKSEYDLVDDVTLILSFISGHGVYSDQSYLYFSHKAIAKNQIWPIEIAFSIDQTLESFFSAKEEERLVLRDVLNKYRDAMQPLSTRSTIVKLWEIIDAISDCYCTNRKKKIPDGHDEDSIRKSLEDRIQIIEKELCINSNERLTPIMLEKSIFQKIREYIPEITKEVFNSTEIKQLKKALKLTYTVRSSFSHTTNKSKKTKQNDSIEYTQQCFLSDLVFLVLLMELRCVPKDTANKTIANLKSYFADNNYYVNLRYENAQFEKKFKEFDDILSGKKRIGKDGFTISF
jgi:hypothetical protein